jgi:hypothetical protein
MQAVERVGAKTGRRIQPRLYVYETLGQLALAYDGEPGTEPTAQVARKSGLLKRLGGWLNRE